MDYPIKYKIYGEGEPLIILHGLFGSLDNWKTFSRQLIEDYQVILVDQRNHGKSFWSEEFSYQLLAKDIDLLMDHLELSTAHMLGHSMGGKVVLELANNYSQRVKSSICVDIGYKKNEPSHHAIFKQILNMNPDMIKSRKKADETLGKAISDPAVRQFLLKSLTRKSSGGFKWKTNFQSLYDNYEHILDGVEVHDIKTPLLFVRGLNSSYISEREKDEILRKIPTSTMIDIKAGHWVHAEKPKELYMSIDGFLKRKFDD